VTDTLQERQRHTATLLADGRVLVAGSSPQGYRQGAFRDGATAEVYDPSTRTWTSTGSMQQARSGHTATLLADGRVVVAGGDGDSPTSGPLLSAELYDPATGTWSQAASMAEGRGGHTATLLADGSVLVIGGERPVPGAEPDTFVPAPIVSAEVYDPAGDKWFSAAPMSEARTGHTATLLPDGRVLVVGGRGGQVLSSVEVYDPSTRRWSAARPMGKDRFDHTATLLDDGRVLIVGGADEGNRTHAVAEAYNPATGTWTQVRELRKDRGGHTATLLTDGRVLVAGGAGSGGIRRTATEVFDPTINTWMPAAEQP
jgi:N-acetylneuraminic acid mutarotase